jgi:hypothetical protein
MERYALAFLAFAAGGVVTAAALTRHAPRAPVPIAEAVVQSAVVPGAPPARPRVELPRGGRTIFPQHRLVGFCGTPGASKLGPLRGNLGRVAKRIETLAGDYAEPERKPLPVFELIAVIAKEERGTDGKSRRRVADAVVEDYLREARAARALLLLNVQPGHSDFLTEVKHFERFLVEPDVGVALDPEWAMTKESKAPGVFLGRTTGVVVDEVARYLSSLVQAHALPEKVLVFHQVNARVLEGESAIVPRDGVVLVKSVDGLGARANKTRTYTSLVATMPPGVHAGFKLFFDEDTADNHKLMAPGQVLALEPKPEYVMYE